MNLPRKVDVGCILNSNVVKSCRRLFPKTRHSQTFSLKLLIQWSALFASLRLQVGNSFQIAIANYCLNDPDSLKLIIF